MHEQLSTCSEITYRLHVGVTRVYPLYNVYNIRLLIR